MTMKSSCICNDNRSWHGTKRYEGDHDLVALYSLFMLKAERRREIMRLEVLEHGNTLSVCDFFLTYEVSAVGCCCQGCSGDLMFGSGC